MNILFNTKLLDSENEYQYIWRLGQAKDSGLLDMDWNEIAKLINIEFRTDETEYRNESAYRKIYQYAKKMYEAGVFNHLDEDKYFKELQIQKQKLKKEKQKLSDERVELNRLIREEARKESFVDMVKRIICEKTEPMNIPVHYSLFNSETDLLVPLSDIHTGIEINNWFNTFNENVLNTRIEKYTSDILDIRGQHNSENCYLVIGEVISGLIHNNLRLQNNMNLMEQFKYVSELISAMIIRLANNFCNVYVYTTPGNHSRLTPKKEDSLNGENFDILLPFYLKARLQNIENVHIYGNEIEPEIAIFNIRGNNVFAVHGHKDSPNNVVQNFTMMFGIKPSIVLLGHRHVNSISTVFNTKVIQTGCVSGSDEFAVNIRKVNRPEQIVSVIGKNGLICSYDLQLD